MAINLAKSFKKQGLNKSTLHEGVVVENKDPDKLGRIRVRIKELHEGIKDEHLPWCIPRFGHPNGAKGGDDLDRTGTFFVPKKKNKVLVEFQDGDPHYPIWHGYTVDDKSRLKETNKNYPDRAIVRFSTGAFMLIDTKTNEIFLHNPGDMYMIVQGDLETNVHGNVQEVCHTEKNKAIDSYYLNDKELPIQQASQHQEKKVNFKGLGKKSKSGNRHVVVEGDYTMTINGDRIIEIKGNDVLKVKGSKTTTIEKSFTLSAGSGIKMSTRGQMIMSGSMVKIN